MEGIYIELVLATISIVSAITAIVFYIGKMKAQIEKNADDINRSRQVIERDVLQLFNNRLQHADQTLANYENAIRNNQVRINQIERFLERSQDFNRTDTNTDLDS